jgi:hypothetical protein
LYVDNKSYNFYCPEYILNWHKKQILSTKF